MKLPRPNRPFWTLRSKTAFGWAVLADRPLPIFSSFRTALNNTALFWELTASDRGCLATHRLAEGFLL